MYTPTNNVPQNYNRPASSGGITQLEELPGELIPEQKYPCIERTLWKSKDSVFRIIPGIAEDGTILRQISDPMELWDKNNPGKHLSDTFFSARVISPFGSGSVISQFAPWSEEQSQYYPPLETFQKIVHNSLDSTRKGIKKVPHPMWSKWIDYRDGNLGWSSVTVMMQALMYIINNAQMSGDANPPYCLYGLVCLNHGPSIQPFLEALTQPMDARKPLDAATNSNLGPVAEQDGCWLYMNSTSYITDKGEQRTMLVPSYAPNGADPRTAEPAMYPLDEKTIRGLWKPWNKLLKFHSMEEQFRLISQNFGPDTVNYVFQGMDVEEFIPMDIKQCGLGRYESLAQSTRNSTRATVAAIAPGSMQAAPMNPKAATTTAPGVQAVPPMPTAPVTPPAQQAIPQQYTRPVVPPGNQAVVDQAKQAALHAGVKVAGAPPIPSIPGTTPNVKFPGINPVPPQTPPGVSDQDLDALVRDAK